jgi:hypothetical protein
MLIGLESKLLAFWQAFVALYISLIPLAKILLPIGLGLWGLAAFINWLGGQFKQCPDCTKVIPRKKESCQFCGHDFRQDERSIPKSKRPLPR